MRYAIFFTPPPATALSKFGAQVLGYDSNSGRDIDRPDHPLFAAGQDPDPMAAPRRYGFHATLKAPFRLKPGIEEDALFAVARDFARPRAPVDMGGLTVGALGGFIALQPKAPPPALGALANACVEAFEPCRAELTAAEMERRLSTPLTERQRSNLDSWGYPHVFEDFRFHMTLSGALDRTKREEYLEALAELYRPIDEPVTIDAISICQQKDAQSNFKVVERIELVG